MGKREGVPLRVRSGDGVPVNVGETVTEGVSVLDRLDPKDVVGVTVAVIVDVEVEERYAMHESETWPPPPLTPKAAPPLGKVEYAREVTMPDAQEEPPPPGEPTYEIPPSVLPPPPP